MKRITLAVFALVLLAGLAGCLSGGDTGSSQATDTSVETETEVFGEIIKSNDGGEVHRFVDREAGTVCYIFDEEGAIGSGAGWQSGISCVPIEHTTLE